MTNHPPAHLHRILAAEGQFDADPTFDHQRQRLQKQRKLRGASDRPAKMKHDPS